MMNATLHANAVRSIIRRVWYAGSGALIKGQGVCYDRDYLTTATGETAADPFGLRDKAVILPDNTCYDAFAGVTIQDYAAKTGGQWVEIYEPGSVCEILTGLVTTNGTTRLTCSASSVDSGWFTRAGLSGRGTARALQTLATSATAAAIPVSASLDGSASVGAGNSTLTKTGLFTNAVAGDKVVILAGTVTASSATAVTAGVYTIVTRTSADVAVLSGSPCAAASRVACYVVRGNPYVLAYLEDGDESGLQEWVSVVGNGGETSPASSAGGTTNIAGGTTVSTGAGLMTLQDGKRPGERRLVYLSGALTTNGVAITSAAITATTSAKNWAATASATIIAAGATAVFEWNGTVWMLVGGVVIVA